MSLGKHCDKQQNWETNNTDNYEEGETPTCKHLKEEHAKNDK